MICVWRFAFWCYMFGVLANYVSRFGVRCLSFGVCLVVCYVVRCLSCVVCRLLWVVVFVCCSLMYDWLLVIVYVMNVS